MEAVTFNEVSYGRAPRLPKLRIAQESAAGRRDSLSSERTGDSGYISDPELSLSPLDFVSPCQVLHTSSDFIYDSAELLDVKVVGSSKIKRLGGVVWNPVVKKYKSTQDIVSAPRIEVTSNPTSVEDREDTKQVDWTPTSQHQARDSSVREDIELWIKDNLHPQDRPKERNLSIVSLDSTGSCDMYSGADDNSDDEQNTTAAPGTLSKATLKTIELIMRKIEALLGHAAYMQCAGGNQPSKAQGNPNAPRASRSSQASSGKRRTRPDESLPPDDPDEDDANKRRRVSITTTASDSETGPRFACPFFKHDPNRYRHRRTCGGPGWPTVHRMKEHLYRSHAQPIYCPRCYAVFDLDAEFAAHIRGVPCRISAPQPIEGINRRTFESLKKRSPALRLEEDKWRDAYQLLFPEVAEADIPSPYYDSVSPSEESRRFRRELLERVRQELFATAERDPGPVEQRLLRQVADIIRRCETDLLDSFHTASTSSVSLPPSRRPSAIPAPDDSASALPNPEPQGQAVHRVVEEHGQALPQPPSPRSSVNDVEHALTSVPLNDTSSFWSSDWIDWNIPFPPGPSEGLGGEREDGFMGLGALVWTR